MKSDFISIIMVILVATQVSKLKITMIIALNHLPIP